MNMRLNVSVCLLILTWSGSSLAEEQPDPYAEWSVGAGVGFGEVIPGICSGCTGSLTPGSSG